MSDNHGYYTIADLLVLKQEIEMYRAKRELDLIDLLGPDVFFAVKGGDNG